MKYIQYHLVDPISGVAIHPSDDAPNGRSHPNYAGLDVKHYNSDEKEFFATCDDVSIDASIIELTEQNYKDALEAEFDKIKANINKKIYDHAQVVRDGIVSE